MTIRPLCLRKLTFTGPNKETASLKFGRGLNVVYGASDTGKSFVLETIDFMLGGSGPLRDIPERVGYDRIALSVEDADAKTFTIFRAASGGNFQLVEGVHETLPEDATPRVLARKHSADSSDNLSSFLLEKIGLAGKRIRINKHDETHSLSFRNLCNLILVDEGQIQKKASPLETGQYTQKARELSVFKLLLTGVDDSAVVAPSKEAGARQSVSAKLEVLNELIEQYKSRIGEEEPSLEELNEQLSKLDDGVVREQAFLQSSQGDYDALVDRRTTLRGRVRAGAERRTEIGELVERFNLLDTHYQSDLKRLDGIVEAGTLVEALVPGVCPLCGAPPEHHNPKAECDGNIGLVVAAATAEREKILRLRHELADTVRQLLKEAGSFDRIVPTMKKQLEALDGQLDLMLPHLSERRASYADFIEKRAQVREALKRYEQIEDLERRRDELEEPPGAGAEEGAIATDLSSTVLDSFSKEIESILQDWHFPDASRVHFEQSNRDLVIAGKQRGSRGKGMRAITHAAFTIGLLEFCRKADNPHPGFVVLDSPLLAYREPEGDEDDLRGTKVQDYFYAFLAGLSVEQAIIIENIDPPEDIKLREQSILFSKNYKIQRFGLFPPLPKS